MTIPLRPALLAIAREIVRECSYVSGAAGGGGCTTPSGWPPSIVCARHEAIARALQARDERAARIARAHECPTHCPCGETIAGKIESDAP